MPQGNPSNQPSVGKQTPPSPAKKPAPAISSSPIPNNPAIPKTQKTPANLSVPDLIQPKRAAMRQNPLAKQLFSALSVQSGYSPILNGSSISSLMQMRPLSSPTTSSTIISPTNNNASAQPERSPAPQPSPVSEPKKQTAEPNEKRTIEENILSSMHDMVVALDNRGRIIEYNEAFSSAANMKRDQILGANYRDIFHIYIVDFQGHMISEQDLLLTEEYHLYYQESDRKDVNTNLKLNLKGRKEDTYISVSVSTLNYQDPQNQSLKGSLVVMHDITKMVLREALKIDFVSMAAHELRTPLTSIRGYINALKEESMDRLDEEHQQFLTRAEISTLQLMNLMENMLSIAKMDKGTYQVDLKEVNWVELVSQRVEEFVPRAHEHHLELKWEPPQQNIPHVMADPMRITEVINNLLSNAIKYTPKGSVTVSIDHDTVKGMINTNIKDTGQGIPPTAAKDLFQKFFRVAGIIEQGSKGTGLGLYITKKIVDLHHGKIWIESQVGEGTTFSFSLPTITKAKAVNKTL